MQENKQRKDITEMDQDKKDQSQDWLQVDARILGQILAAQNILFVLPNETRIAEYFSEALKSIPGISSCFVCMINQSVPVNNSHEVCNDCLIVQKSRNELFIIPNNFTCGLAARQDIKVITLRTNEHTFGFFIFQTDSSSYFELYSPFVSNLANYVALSLENRMRKNLLIKSRDELENKVIERTEELRLMNERFMLATNAARLGVWDWDIPKNELKWDENMYTLYGIKKGDFAGAYEAWLSGLHPDDRTDSDKMSKLAQLGIQDYDTEFRVVWPNGSIRYLKAYGKVVRDAGNRPLRMTGINFDITEQKQAEQEIRKLNQELEQRVVERTAQLEVANKELESFSYSVSHDLRTPLRGIDGFSQILLDEYKDKIDEQGVYYLQRVRSAAQRMAQLIDEMLNLSRVSRSEINYQQVNLSQVFREIADDIRGTQPERKVEFIIQEGIKVLGDGQLIRIVLENLIGNAWKFTSKHLSARIEFGMQHKKELAVYFVRDDGAGFDMNYTSKLFGAFQRLHAVTEFPGTGVGLATVQRIIHRHGGKIWAEGETEKGATFYFTIPKSISHDK